MIEQVQIWYQQFMTFANQNQMVAGAVSLWGLTVVSYLCRGIPSVIWTWLKRNCVTTITLNNTDWQRQLMMANLLEWLKKNGHTKFSRTFSYTPRYMANEYDGEESPIVSVGYGIHYFFYHGRFMWLNLSKLESSGSERQKEEISISLLGRSKKPFNKLAEDFTPPRKENKYIHEFDMSSNDWVPVKRVVEKRLDTVGMNENVENFVKKTIDDYLNAKEWYYERGIAYKLTAILHGRAGTGKTSLIRAIATYYKKNICVLNLSKMSDSSFASAINNLPDNSLLSIEDFDSFSAVKDRTQKMKNDSDEYEFLTLSGVLNALDGVSALDSTIILMTTNHLDHIDKAVYRRGRVDHIVEVNALEPEVVKKQSERIFPDYEFPENFFNKPLVGCHIHAAIIHAMDDPEKYVEYLTEVWNNNNHLVSS